MLVKRNRDVLLLDRTVTLLSHRDWLYVPTALDIGSSYSYPQWPVSCASAINPCPPVSPQEKYGGTTTFLFSRPRAWPVCLDND